MAFKLDGTKFKAWADDGTPLSLGMVYTYEAGTSTPKASYTSEGQSSANTNPVVLDARGEADIFLDGSYKIILTDSDDVEIDTVDPVTDPSGISKEWPHSYSASQASSTSLTVSGNRTSVFTENRPIRVLDGGTYKYGYVSSSSYSSPNTTVVVVLSTALTVSVTEASLHVIEDFEVFRSLPFFDVFNPASFSDLRSYLTLAIFDEGDVVTVTDDGIFGDGKIVVAVGAEYTDNGGTIIVANGGTSSAGMLVWLRPNIGGVRVKWFGAVGDGIADDTAACQAAIDYADSVNISLVVFDQGVYDVTGLTIPDDINLMGVDTAFGLTFNFTPANRWGSVIQNTTTSSPTLEWTKVAGSSHVIPAHLKITGNALQTSVVKFAAGVFNNSGMQNCGVYSFEAGTAGPGADYCVEFANGGFDFFMGFCYMGKGATANIKVAGAALRLQLTNISGDVSGDCLIETDFACDISIQNHYFENFSGTFNLVNHLGTVVTTRPSLNLFGISNTTVPFNAIWKNVNSNSEFIVPQIECTGWKGQFPTYIFQDSAGTNDTLYPGIRSGWSFYTGAGKETILNKRGSLTPTSSIDVGGSNAVYDLFTLNSFNTPVRIEEIRGGWEGRKITIVEIGGPLGPNMASFATAANNLSVSSLTRSGSTATVTTAVNHYYTTGDVITISGANETDYNGSYTITVTGATTFNYTVSGTPTTPATGTITCSHTNANIRGNDSQPIYGALRTAWTFQYINGFWEYLSDTDARSLNLKKIPGPYASNAAAAVGGVLVGQIYYDNATGDRVLKVRF